MKVDIKNEVSRLDATAFEAQDVERKEPGKSPSNKRGQNLADHEGGETPDAFTRLI